MTRRIGLRCAGLALAALALGTGTGCGTLARRAAVRSMEGLFAAPGGANVFAADDDPELVRDALPFALKTYELLLQEDPRNTELAAAAAAAFVQYANGFVHRDALVLQHTDFDAAVRAKQRAARLYLRGRDYALAGLEVRHPGLGQSLQAEATAAAGRLTRADVPLAFWAGAGWAGAIAASGTMERVAELPAVEALLRRVLELDEAYEDGAVHELFISFEGSRDEAMGGSPQRARGHFERAVELSGGRKATPYVALAETVAVRRQDLGLFRELLGQALAVDPDAVPQWRLANVLAQEKARWLLDHVADLFVEVEETP